MRFTATIIIISSTALLAAACGSSPGSPSSNQSSKPSATAAFEYASCIRDHGVSSFPDPVVRTTAGGGGSVTQQVPASAGLSPKFQAAQRACRGILPAAVTGAHRHGPSKQAFLAFAQCLRAHGIANFPDPGAQGQLTLDMIGAAGVDIRGPAFFTAAKACVGVTHGQIPLAAVVQAINGHH